MSRRCDGYHERRKLTCPTGDAPTPALVLGVDAFILIYQLITLHIGYLSYPVSNAVSRGFPADPLLPPRNDWGTGTSRPAVKEVIFENEEDDEEAQMSRVRPDRGRRTGQRQDSHTSRAGPRHDGGNNDQAEEEDDLYSEVDDLLQRTGRN